MMTKAMLSLSGKNILVTRARSQASELNDALSELGANVLERPLLEIGPPDSWQDFDRALRNIGSYDWILLASTNSVEALISRLGAISELNATSELNASGELNANSGLTVHNELSVDNGLRANKLQLPETVKVAAIGKSTKEALEKNGLPCHFYPSQYIAEALVNEFPGYPNLAGTKILWPRTNVGRTYIIEELTKCGAQVETVSGYKTCLPQNIEALGQEIVGWLSESRLDVITLASAQTVKNFARILKGQRGESDSLGLGVPVLGSCKLASIGPETSRAIKEELGIEPHIEAGEYTIEGLVKAIVAYFNPQIVP